MKKRSILFLLVCLLLAGCGGKNLADLESYNRSIGHYPGNPKEDFAPTFVQDDTYKNIAAYKAAYNSSSYDYNLTAQLTTDGIISQEKAPYTQLTNANGVVPRNEKEWLFDQIPVSNMIQLGEHLLLQLDLNGFSLQADKFTLKGNVYYGKTKSKGYDLKVWASTDGQNWEVIDQIKGAGYWGEEVPSAPSSESPKNKVKNPSPVTFLYPYKEDPNKPEPVAKNFWTDDAPKGIQRSILYTVQLPGKSYSHFKIEGNMPSANGWQFSAWDFYSQGQIVTPLASEHYSSSWKSAGNGEEWVYVDLGTTATFDKIKLHWINKAIAGKIQASADAVQWQDLADLPGGNSLEDEIDVNGNARYVRVLCRKSANGDAYELSELEVWGKGGLKAMPAREIASTPQKQLLNGGAWKLMRASEVHATGEQISQEGYNTKDWLLATVPGTVLTSYRNLGAIPDPNYKDNQLQISESYFLSDFWYQREFQVDQTSTCTFLNFDGINWKANVFLNGKALGKIEGAFYKGIFNITPYLKPGKNILAVQIVKNAHPGAVKEQTPYSADKNGGILGADNPTFHASIGWDWIPTIRGRNIGIWNDVYLTYTGPVTVEDPFVRTELPLPDTTSANIFAQVKLKNQLETQVKGILKGTFGDQKFQKEITLAPHQDLLVDMNPSNTPELHLDHPQLWWPKGYGAQHLYDVSFSFETEGKVSDQVRFKSGVRQVTFDENEYLPSGGLQKAQFGEVGNHRLSLYVNGRRFIGFGGNWGFPESNLNYRGREYDVAVRYHADMNFTMIRNWVGMTGDEEFYEACDKYGVMIWQDFWLANPSDGPDPYNNKLFMSNVTDWIKRIRNHPAIALYVGRNEGNPPAELDQAIRKALPLLHPGIHYISHSASGVVSGGGPYRALSQKEYFENHGHDKFHSERGMPNVMAYESLVQALGQENLEPVNTHETPNNLYGIHDYTLDSAQGADSFNKLIEKMFGKPKDARQFTQWAQFINYNGYRAIFEGRSEHRRGMLLWMSHPTWPSMVWQTYDYYFDPTAAYFACKKACEPIHIQWNPVREDVEVVNYHAGNKQGLSAKAQIFNQDGSLQWSKEITLNIREDQTVALFPLEISKKLSRTYFIKLTLKENSGKVLSDNFYIRGQEEGNYQSLLQLPKVTLTSNLKAIRKGNTWTLSGVIKNPTATPAIMVRLQVKGETTHERMLPVLYNDNYFSLLPGEEKQVSITLDHADTRGEQPYVELSGFNLK